MSPEQGSSSDSTPIVTGVLSAVAGAALIAFAVVSKRRRLAKQKNTPPPLSLPTYNGDDDNLEHGRGLPQLVPPPSYEAVLALGDGSDNPPAPDYEADGIGGAGIVAPLAPASLVGPTRSSTEPAANASEDCDTGLVRVGTADSSAGKLTDTASTATASTANVSSHERAELAQFHQRQGMAVDPSSVASGPEEAAGGGSGAPPATDRQNPTGDLGLGHAVLAAAQELAYHCQVPGISEAAGVLCIMANLVTDSRESDRANDSRLRQCRSIVMALKRAEKVVGTVSR